MDNNKTETVETTVATAEVPTPTEEQVNQAIDTALDEAVKSVVAGGDAPAPQEKKEAPDETGAEEPKVADETAIAKPGADAPKEEPTAEELKAAEAIFERGVKAGLTIEELKGLPGKIAENYVAMAEKAAGISPKKGEEEVVAGSPDDELGATIEEMENDGEYDPKILGLLKGLYKKNKDLETAGKTAAEKSFFDRQLGSLDEGLRTHVDAAHLSKLKSKFDLLEAGYKAQGAKISREDVFQEAAKLALGDLMNKRAEERKATALEQRKNLTLARPGGENGQYRRGKGPATEEDIASELWDQITRN